MVAMLEARHSPGLRYRKYTGLKGDTISISMFYLNFILNIGARAVAL
jgi:hypothetical protein